MSKDNTKGREREHGSASLLVDLDDGVLTVRHGSSIDDDGEFEVLIERPIYGGEWASMFKQLKVEVLRV